MNFERILNNYFNPKSAKPRDYLIAALAGMLFGATLYHGCHSKYEHVEEEMKVDPTKTYVVLLDYYFNLFERQNYDTPAHYKEALHKLKIWAIKEGMLEKVINEYRSKEIKMWRSDWI